MSKKPVLQQMLEVFNEYQTSVIGGQEVPLEVIGKYCSLDGKKVEDGVYKVQNLIEKPKPDEVFSNIAILGRYILTPKIFHYLETQTPGAGGEIQLTDSLNRLAHDEIMYAYLYKGKRYDIGSKMGFLQSNIEVALRNPEVSEQLKEYLNALHENMDEMLSYD